MGSFASRLQMGPRPRRLGEDANRLHGAGWLRPRSPIWRCANRRRWDHSRGDQRLASDEQLATYKRVRIDRVHVFFEPGSAGRALPASSQRLLAKRFGRALRSEVGEHYELVQDLGLVQDDVLRIRVTLTEVNLAHTDSDEVANATVEVEVVDALTGQRVAAAVSRRSARETPSSADDSLDEADHAFGQWALNLREWLDTFMSS